MSPNCHSLLVLRAILAKKHQNQQKNSIQVSHSYYNVFANQYTKKLDSWCLSIEIVRGLPCSNLKTLLFQGINATAVDLNPQ